MRIFQTTKHVTYADAVPGWLYGIGILFAFGITVPLIGLGSAIPWTRLPSILLQPIAQDALWVSLVSCVISTAIVMVIGIPLAMFSSSTKPGASLVRVLVTLPLALPPVVAGLALTMTFGRNQWLGKTLENIGLPVNFNLAAVVLAQIFVSLPFFVMALRGALQTRALGYEDVALCLGASRNYVFTRVTLPLLAPAIWQGMALAFARSLGEFGATITFAGSLPGVTRTLPLEIYVQRESDNEVALALSAMLVLLAIVVLASIQMVTWFFDRRKTATHDADSCDDGNPAEFARSPMSLSRMPMAELTTFPSLSNSCTTGMSLSRMPMAELTAMTNTTASFIQSDHAHLEPNITNHPYTQAAKTDILPAEVSNDSSPRTSPGVIIKCALPDRNLTLAHTFSTNRTTAIIGPNGAGKTTLAHVLAGLIIPTDGLVRINDRIVTSPSLVVAPQQRGVSLVQQNPLLFPMLNVLENVAFGLHWNLPTKQAAREQALHELSAWGIAHLASRNVGTLSGGQQAVVALARAFAINPQLLLLDEPFAALDITHAAQIRKIVAKRLQNNPCTVLLITHNKDDVTWLCDEVVVLDGGRIQEATTPTQLRENPKTTFAKAFSGML